MTCRRVENFGLKIHCIELPKIAGTRFNDPYHQSWVPTISSTGVKTGWSYSVYEAGAIVFMKDEVFTHSRHFVRPSEVLVPDMVRHRIKLTEMEGCK